MIALEITVGILVLVLYLKARKDKQIKLDSNPYNTVKSDQWYKNNDKE